MPAEKRKRSRVRVLLRWMRRGGKGTLFLLATVMVLALGFLAYLTQTDKGQRMALEFLLDQVRGSLAGELTIGGIRSAGLLGGATLYDVELTAAGDRRFLVADSIRLRYSPVGLISRTPRLASARIWGVDMEISKYSEEQPLNVTQLLRPRPEGAPPGTRTEITLGTVTIEGGLVQVLTPVEAGTERPTVPSPVGGPPLSRLALEDIVIEVDDAVIRAGYEESFTGFLADVRTEVYLMEDPLTVTGGEGKVTFGNDGLRLADAFLTFPGSRARGVVALGPQSPDDEGWGFSADVETQGPADLADFQWLDPRIPDGTADGGIVLSVGSVMDIELHDLQIELEASSLEADGSVQFVDGVIVMDGLDVQASPLVLSRAEPWLGFEFPVDGFLSGQATLSGTFTSLQARGRMTLVPSGYGGRSTTADFRGRFYADEANPGVSDLVARLDPVNFELLNVLQPGFVPPATGVVYVEANGRAAEGVRFSTEVDFRPDAYSDSHFTADGLLRRNRGGTWITDIDGDLQPFSLDVLAHAMPDAGLQGEASGPVHVFGPLDDLEVGADLSVGEGRAVVDGRFNALQPDGEYRLDVRVEKLALETVSKLVPERSDLTGTLLLEGRGFDPASAEMTAQVVSGSSRYGGLRVDTARADLRAENGLLMIDTLEAGLAGLHVTGSGTLGLVGEREGRAVLNFDAESIAGIRTVFMGDTVIAGDTLSALDRVVLESGGFDLSTLPDTADVTVAGSVHGSVELEGSIEAMDATGQATLLGARYGRNMVDSAEVTFKARGLPSAVGSMDLTLAAEGMTVQGREFRGLDATVSMSNRAGTADLYARLGENEDVTAEGTFALDSLWNGTVDLREARAQIDTLTYELLEPARLSWDASSLTVENLEVRRPGEDHMRLRASGRLSRRGESDFDLDVEGIHLEVATRLFQLDSLDIGGHVDLDLTVSGPASAPTIVGAVRADGLSFGSVTLDSISGTLAYDDQEADIDLSAWDEGRRAFRADGQVPLNLAFDAPGGVIMDNAPMDMRVVADSLQAEVLTAYLTFLQDPVGSVSGEFRIEGTMASPRPGGVLRIEDLSYGIEAIGVRHDNVGGTLRLNPDGTVTVDVTADAGGRAVTTGTIDLEPLLNPTLDLKIAFSQFQAVDRADVEGAISGSVDLKGTYERPAMTGSLIVDEGTVFLDEFSRNSRVIDLTDLRLLRQVVDTTALTGRPILAGIRNPFLDNLRMDVSLSVPQDVWLRSPDMNVEIGGALEVSYDRRSRDIVLVGDLEALRGSYNVLGRSFEVESGTVSFIGTPGINPTLEIQAATELRRASDQGAPMQVTATVSGTLTQPQVTLGTNEAAVSEADLISYLVFGRPTSEIGGSQGALASGLGGAALGQITAQLGASVAQRFGVDYLSVSQAADAQLTASGFLGGTRVEVGRYIGDDIFLIFLLRPEPPVFAGAQVEVALSDSYTLEGFIEDRFLRSALAAFEAVETSRIVGVFVFREWGY